MQVTFSIEPLACGHINITATLPTRTVNMVTHRDEIAEDIEDISYQTKALIVLISYVKERRAAGRTWAQVKADVEAKTFYI